MYLDLRARIPVVASWVEIGSERLQAEQDRIGLSNEKIARELHLSEKTWRRYKQDGHVPRAMVPAFAQLFGWDIGELAPPRTAVQIAADEDVRSGLSAIRAEVAALREALELMAETLRRLEDPPPRRRDSRS